MVAAGFKCWRSNGPNIVSRGKRRGLISVGENGEERGREEQTEGKDMRKPKVFPDGANTLPSN